MVAKLCKLKHTTVNVYYQSVLVCLKTCSLCILGVLQVDRWNFLFAFLAVPAILQLCVLPFLPESPRFLLIERRDEARAEKGTE